MKKIIQAISELHVRIYFKKQKVKLIVITGSVGKTSTKNAIVTVLSQKYRVRAHKGNHNTHMSVPLALMGIPYPETSLRSPLAWLKVFILMWIRIVRPRDVDVIVQELGTDAPGDIPAFGRYLHPDIAVITAVAEEHMEFFGSLDAVAQEELSVASYSKLVVVNRDDIPEQYAKYAETTNIDTYGTSGVAEYRYEIQDTLGFDGFYGKFISPEFGELPVTLRIAGEHNIRAAVAAGLVGVKYELNLDEISRGLSEIRPVAGRMRLLRGLNDSTLLDDTYNASPTAVAAALKTLYSFPAPQRIAILGSMNELGQHSPAAHEDIGKLCDPRMLAGVITIGEDAEKYLAPVARRRGCNVISFSNPYEAGAYAHKILESGAVVLAKGSQNGVFAEEALKMLLHTTADEWQLVRQSQHWIEKKQKQFLNKSAEYVIN